MTNSRTIRRAVALAVLLHWLGWHARAWSQITGPAEIEMGEPLILESKAVAPAGGLIKHLWSGECKFIEADGGRLIYVWPPQPGVYDFGDMVATYAPAEKDGDVGTLTQTPYTHTVTVKSASPQPQPQPNVETLRSMVDAETAAKLSASFSSILPVATELVGKETCGGARKGIAEVIRKAGVADDSKAGVELAKRFDAALGDKPEAPTTDKYPAAIKQVIAELGQPAPPVPTPDAGKRLVVIIRESADDTPSQGSAFVALRDGQQADYLKSKGHALELLDPNDVDATGKPAKLVTELAGQYGGQQLPLVFILDPQTHAVIDRKPWPGSAQGVIDILKSNGG